MCVSGRPLVNQSFFRGFTIFPMKRTVRVYLSRITRRKGLLNLTRGGWGTSPDLQVISFTVAPAASVPFSWTFSTALWITCKDTKQNDLQVTTWQEESSLPPFLLLPRGALPGARPSSISLRKVITSRPPSHCSSTIHQPLLLVPLLRVQGATLKQQTAKVHSRWLMARNPGSKKTW